jgi:gentisate 1,2-dioxygenase
MKPVNPMDYGRANPQLVYPWQMAKTAVEQAAGVPGDPCDDTAMEYQNPTNGGPVTDTLAARMLRMRPGFEGKPQRQTGSKVYHIVEGEGETTVNGETFRWGKNDFLSIPPWALHSSRIAADVGPALVMEVNDHPTLQKLGFFRQDRSGN